MTDCLDCCTQASRWRNRHPAEKLHLALGLLACSLLLPPWPGGLVVTVAVWGLALGVARLPLRSWLGALSVPAGFVLLSAASLLLRVEAGAGGWRLGWQPAAGPAAGELLLRSVAATSSLVLLALTTPLSDLVAELRRLGAPAALCELMGLIYRLLFVFSATATALLVAQAARLGYRTWRTSWRSISLAVSGLLLHSLARARRLETGLAARGYDGELAVLALHDPLRPLVVRRQWAGLLLLALVAWGLGRVMR